MFVLCVRPITFFVTRCLYCVTNHHLCYKMFVFGDQSTSLLQDVCCVTNHILCYKMFVLFDQSQDVSAVNVKEAIMWNGNMSQIM